MPKDLITVEIKHIPLEVKESQLGGVELADVAAQVERFMLDVQADGEIDTLKQALLAALHFAAQAYFKNQNEGGKRREEMARVDELILKLKSAQETT